MDRQQFSRAFKDMVSWETFKPPRCQFPGCTDSAEHMGYGYGSPVPGGSPSKMYACDRHYRLEKEYWEAQ